MLFAGCVLLATSPGPSFSINCSGTSPHGNLPCLPYALLLVLWEFNHPLNMLLCLQDRENWFLSSSLLRHMDSHAIKNCRIIPRPGKTFWTMNSEIQQGRIKVYVCKVIAFLLRTNDVDAVVSCKFGVVGHKVRYRRDDSDEYSESSKPIGHNCY